MRKILFAFMLVLFSVSMNAQKKTVLSVLMNDGTNICFHLNDKPEVTFVDDAVKIVSNTNDATVKRADVKHFEFLPTMPTGADEIEEEAVEGNIEIGDNIITISGLLSGSKAQIFSVNGQQQMAAAAGKDGCVTLSLDALASGIYLVNYNEITIKFIKR